MKKQRAFNYLLMILFIVSLVSGTVGLVMSGETFNNAFFDTLTMFAMNYTEVPQNILVNIARYGAAVFTIGALLNIFSRAFVVLSLWIKSKKAESTLVFGNTKAAELMFADIKSSAIKSDEYANTKKYLLLGKEKDNLAFYFEHSAKLKDKKVYVLSNSFANMTFQGGKHRFFSEEEIFACGYWEKHSLIDQAFNPDGLAKEKLIIIFPVFNQLVEELIFNGTQRNVFSAKQIVEYHIFGAHESFCKSHNHLEELHIIPHSESWIESLELLKSATRIIMPINKNQLMDAKKLAESVRTGTLHILSDFKFDEEILLNSRSGSINPIVDKVPQINMIINVICWQEEVFTCENIFENERLRKAKEFNRNYDRKYGGNKDMETLWEGLDSFTRYSNLAAIDYHSTRKKLLAKWGYPEGVTKEQIKPDQFEELAEMEHIRWNYYHFFNNWDIWDTGEYGKPLKDIAKRIHKDLKMYEDLPESEKQKDREQIEFMLDAANRNL